MKRSCPSGRFDSGKPHGKFTAVNLVEDGGVLLCASAISGRVAAQIGRRTSNAVLKHGPQPIRKRTALGRRQPFGFRLQLGRNLQNKLFLSHAMRLNFQHDAARQSFPQRTNIGAVRTPNARWKAARRPLREAAAETRASM